GSASTIAFAALNTSDACSRSAAALYTCAPCTPSPINPYSASAAHSSVFPFLRGRAIKAVRYARRVGSSSRMRPNNSRTIAFCHGRRTNGSPAREAMPSVESVRFSTNRTTRSARVLEKAGPLARCRATLLLHLHTRPVRWRQSQNRQEPTQLPPQLDLLADERILLHLSRRGHQHLVRPLGRPLRLDVPPEHVVHVEDRKRVLW